MFHIPLIYCYSGFSQKPFTEYLKHKKLSSNVCHFVQHSIAMVTDTATTEEVIIRRIHASLISSSSRSFLTVSPTLSKGSGFFYGLCGW